MAEEQTQTQIQAERRRSERILQELLIRVAWKNSRGKEMRANTRTVDVSRFGAKIVLSYELPAGQEISVYCLITEMEGQARVIGLSVERPKVYFYGIEFTTQNNNLWNIPFRLFFDELE